MLYDKIGGRAVVIAEYVAETGATVREAAIRFGVSKSMVNNNYERFV